MTTTSFTFAVVTGGFAVGATSAVGIAGASVGFTGVAVICRTSTVGTVVLAVGTTFTVIVGRTAAFTLVASFFFNTRALFGLGIEFALFGAFAVAVCGAGASVTATTTDDEASSKEHCEEDGQHKSS